MAMTVGLNSTNARQARIEASCIEPTKEKVIRGYRDGDCVYISVVRKAGDRAPVATALRNRRKPANTFEIEIK